jgi:hypothetical protein
VKSAAGAGSVEWTALGLRSSSVFAFGDRAIVHYYELSWLMTGSDKRGDMYETGGTKEE